MYRKDNNFHLIQPGKLLAILGVVALVFFLILPSSRQLVLNLWNDGDRVRAAEELEKIPLAERAKDPQFWRDIEQGIVEMSVFTGTTNANMIAEKALEQFSLSGKTENETIAIVKVLRSTARPDLAARVIEDYEKDSGKTNASHSDEMIQLKVTVFQENNRTSEAFDAYFAHFKQQDEISKDSLIKLHQLARAGNKMSDVIGLASDPSQLRKLENSRTLQDAEVYELLGDIALAGGDNDAAIGHYQKALELDDSRNYIYAQIAKAYEWSNRPNEAFDNYIKSLGNDDDYAIERLLDLASGLYKTQDLGDVLAKHPEKILELDKGLFLARVFLENGDNESAYKWYENICWGEEPRSDVYLEYISVLIAAQEYEKAVEFSMEGQKKFPEMLEFNELIGDVLVNLLQYEQAFDQYYELVSENLNHSALRKTIDIGVALGKHEEIAILLSKHRSAGVLNTSYLYEQLAMSEFRKGNFNEFQSIILEGYQKEPNNIHLLEKLFLSHQKLGRYDRAIAMIDQYPDQLLKNPYILDFYLDNILASEDIAKAERILEIHPRDGKFSGDLIDNTLKNRYRARIATLKKDYTGAIAIYRQMDKDNALQDFHLIPYLELLVLEKDFVTANALVDKMAGLDHEDFYLHAARSYVYQGQNTKAQKYIDRISTPIKLAHLWRDIGDHYELNGDTFMARDAYRKAMEFLTSRIN